MDVREEVEEACIQLQTNDEGFTELSLMLAGEGIPLNQAERNALMAALSANTHVNGITLYADLENASDLISFIAETLLPNHPSLEALSLGYNGITNDHVAMIAEATKRNPRLKSIALIGEDIGVDGARALAEGLCHKNSGVEILGLIDTNVGVVGCRAIASTLDKSRLKFLCLEDCGIGDEGANAVVDKLCLNKLLVNLQLKKNNIGDEGCCSLAGSLRHNDTLQILDLTDNQITDAGAAALEASLLHVNYTLEVVDLQQNEGVSEAQQDRINRLCDDNHRVKRAFCFLLPSLHVVPLCLFPEALELVKDKPDLLYAVLKAKPLLFDERPVRRKRKRPQWLRY